MPKATTLFPFSLFARFAWLVLLLAWQLTQAEGQSAPAPTTPTPRGSAIGAAEPPAATKRDSIETVMIAGQPYLRLDFHLLASFPFDAPNEKLTNDAAIAQVEKQIPPAIKSLDGKNVIVRGFMVPIKDAQGRSTEFLLVRDQPTCCYSGMTTITEFVSVKVPGRGVESIVDQPVAVQGRLHVGAVIESGYVLGVYRMEGETLFDSKCP